MIVVQLQKSEAYQSLYTLSGYSVMDSLTTQITKKVFFYNKERG